MTAWYDAEREAEQWAWIEWAEAWARCKAAEDD